MVDYPLPIENGKTSEIMNMEKSNFPEKQTCYFLTFNTADWVDVFIRPVYKQIVVHSLNHFIDHKGLNVYAWCLMTNHLHLIAQARANCVMAEIEHDFKSFTAKKILEAIDTEPEVRKEWMMERFEHFSNVLGFIKKFQVWQTCSNPMLIDLGQKDKLIEQVDYIHSNPVRDKIVDTDSDYLYSSARDYSGMRGLVNIQRLPAIEQHFALVGTTGHFFEKFIHN